MAKEEKNEKNNEKKHVNIKPEKIKRVIKIKKV